MGATRRSGTWLSCAARVLPNLKTGTSAALVALVFGVSACSGAGSTPYGARSTTWGQPEALPSLKAHEQSAVDALRAVLAERGYSTAPVLDARFSRAARALNHIRAQSRLREACDVSTAAQDAALDWAGVYERPACNRCYWTRKDNVPVPQEVILGMAECLAGPGQVLLGVSSLEDDGRTFVSLTGARRQVALDPVPRVIPRGDLLTLSGVVDPAAGPFTLLLVRPDRPVEAVSLEPDAGDGSFKLPLGQVPTWLLAAIQGPLGEHARMRFTAVQRDPRGGAFAMPQDDKDMDLAERTQSLLAWLQRGRKARSLPPFVVDAVLNGAAQDDSNAAQLPGQWLKTPVTPERLKQVQEQVAGYRIIRLVGSGVGELTSQLGTNAELMWFLTRPGTVKLGLGTSTPPDMLGQPQLALSLIVGSTEATALDLPSAAPSSPAAVPAAQP